jgi:hypothetical protein
MKRSRSEYEASDNESSNDDTQLTIDYPESQLNSQTFFDFESQEAVERRIDLTYTEQCHVCRYYLKTKTCSECGIKLCKGCGEVKRIEDDSDERLCSKCYICCEWCGEYAGKDVEPTECRPCGTSTIICDDCRFYCNECGSDFCGDSYHYHVTCEFCMNYEFCSECINSHLFTCIHCQTEGCERLGCVVCTEIIAELLHNSQKKTQKCLGETKRFSDCTIKCVIE